MEKNIDPNDTNAFRYCGGVYYFDKETGDYYIKARYYDPTIGRFITEDSVWGKDNDVLSLNLYTYCGNSPIMNTDPTGHIFGVDDAIEIAAVVALVSETPEGQEIIAEAENEGTQLSTFVADNLESVKDTLTQAGVNVKDAIVQEALKAKDQLADKAVSAWNTISNFFNGGSQVESTFDWESIKGTQPLIEGTNVPKSFVINNVEVNGNDVWVNGNAAKLASEQTLKPGDNSLFVGGWEIGINGTTGVIYHSLMK